MHCASCSMFIDSPDHTIEHQINSNNLLQININISLPAYPCAGLDSICTVSFVLFRSYHSS
jgi:hypothetical protein